MDMPNRTVTAISATSRTAAPPLAMAERISGLWHKLSSLVLTDDVKQRATIIVQLLTLLFSVVLIYLLYYGLDQNMFDEGPLLTLAIIWIVIVCIAHGMVRSGFNLRFADKTMAMPQTCLAQTFAVAAYGYTGLVHPAMLVTMSLIMVFGVFNMKERATCIACVYSILLLGAMMVYKTSTDPLQYPGNIEWIYFTVSTSTMLLISGLSVRMCLMRRRLKQRTAQLELAYRQVQELSTRDELTGLPNRRNLKQLLDLHVERQARTGQNFYLAMLDLDHFKRVNDTWGHQVGDDVLKNIARCTCARPIRLGAGAGRNFYCCCPKPVRTRCHSAWAGCSCAFPVWR